MSEPVTLQLAKDHCRVIGDDEDLMIEQLIVAARTHVERATGQTLIERTIVQSFDCFARSLRLSAWPIAATPNLSVEYRDPLTGVWTAVTPTPLLLADRWPAQVIPAVGTSSWPGALKAPQSVRVTLIAGYDAESCPADLVQAMLLLIGHWHANREAGITGSISTEVDFGVGLLIEDYRRML